MAGCVSFPDRYSNNQITDILAICREYNYQRITLDVDSVSDIKQIFMLNLDPYGLFFMQEDILSLCSINFSIDDSKPKILYSFLDKTLIYYEQRLKEARQITRDAYIHETYNVICDYIKFLRKTEEKR